jgi:uncharacterized C2H2 Zn-finger protein
MQDNSFVYNNETVNLLNGYLVVNNCSIVDLFQNMTISDILICGLCVVQMESAYVFRELCRQAALIWRNKYSASQIIKFEHADEVDNDSDNDIPPAVVDNVENEQVSGENDEYVSNCGSETESNAENCEEPTHSNGAKKSDNHQTAKNYSCPECERTYRTQRALLEHKKRLHSQEAKKFSCANCVNIYGSKRALVAHIKTEHLKIRYSCKICPSVYRRKVWLRDHIQREHEDNSFACITCGKLFRNQRSLTIHKKKVHLGVFL